MRTALQPSKVNCGVVMNTIRRKIISKGCLTSIWNSGLVVRTPDMDAAANSSGVINDWPLLLDMEWKEEARSANVGGTNCACASGDYTNWCVRTRRRNNCWEWDNLTALCWGKTGEDMINSLYQNTTYYWMQDHEQDALHQLIGIMEHSVANFGGDLIYDVSAAELAANSGVLTSEIILNADQSCTKDFDGILVCCEDYKRFFSPAIHLAPAVARTEMTILEGITLKMADFDGKKLIPTCHKGSTLCTYNGPATGGVDKKIAVLFCDGMFNYGEGNHPNPQSLVEDECKNNGDGGWSYHERTQYVISSTSHKWKETNVAGAFPTNAEIADPANYERVCEDPDLVGLKFITY